MNKEEILVLLNRYSLPKEEFIIISGAAMVLLGIKEETNDIDIAVSLRLYKRILEKYNCKFEKTDQFNNKIYFIDDIINFGQNYYDVDYLIYQEYQVQTPQAIKVLKKNLNRAKDQKDIALIDKYLKENNNG